LAAKSFNFSHGDALHPNRGERFSHFVQLKGLDDGGYKFHGFSFIKMMNQ